MIKKNNYKNINRSSDDFSLWEELFKKFKNIKKEIKENWILLIFNWNIYENFIKKTVKNFIKKKYIKHGCSC